MGELFLGGSLIAAFFAGTIALFAPCCIVFMFPSYLSVAIKNRRRRLLPLTFVFAAGISVVLLPVTLGVSALSRSLLQYHVVLYAVGGSLLIGLAVLAATGRTWMLPMMRQSPDITRTDSGGVFALGVFSGAASACCAPVLAGVITLSAVSPSLLQSTAMGFAYVFGMVFPLVIMTAVWDRAGLANRPGLRGRVVRWHIGSKKFVTNTLDLVAAALFSIMGVLLWVIAVTGASVSVAFQDSLSVWLQERFRPIIDLLEPVPDALIGLGLVAISVGAIALTSRRRPLNDSSEEGEQDVESTEDQPSKACH
jgi:cytochrome c-type biogenesis protein